MKSDESGTELTISEVIQALNQIVDETHCEEGCGRPPRYNPCAHCRAVQALSETEGMLRTELRIILHSIRKKEN